MDQFAGGHSLAREKFNDFSSKINLKCTGFGSRVLAVKLRRNDVYELLKFKDF